MQQTPFHAYVAAQRLANLIDNYLIPALASSDINIYPYQIAAAEFALRSPYLKGCILCDEGSLGKTFEALLIATQKWYEGKTRQLVILPVNLVKQWTDKIERSFTLPFVLLDNATVMQSDYNPFEQDALVITTYDFAVMKAEYIKKLKWDLIIFDEADCLNKSYLEDNKISTVLKDAANGYKLLLTPTPIEMDIRDIYGLIHFIDESVLPDINEFYARYFRKPENYHELTAWVSKFCFYNASSALSTEYYNLFVIGDEAFNDGCFLIEKERALTISEGISTEISEQFAALTPESISAIKTLPSLFASENHQYGRTDPDQLAFFGMVTDIKIQENGIKIYFQKFCSIPQQRLNELMFNLAIKGKPSFNELNRTHWAIKRINLIEELKMAGISVLAPT